jgi:hypothetical protein
MPPSRFKLVPAPQVKPAQDGGLPDNSPSSLASIVSRIAEGLNCALSINHGLSIAFSV